ncbi:MAG: creatinine amidohydrolase [Candidatus Sumerlaeota bacterium]|nr:creatinine amidohydrolase [Candidatus Sumerlaeota bacterium]
MPIREWILAETNLRRIKQRQYEVAVLPIGATEAHNWHLPEGQDTAQADYVARRACELAWPQCHSVVCLPPIPYGVDANLMSFPLSMHVSQAVLDAMVRELLTSLKHHGIRKTVIVNSHGGNDFTALIRQVQPDLDIHVFLCNWWTVGKDRYAEFFGDPGDHAGELETAAGLALHPDLVEMEHAADGAPKPFRFEALEKGWVKTSRDFGRLNDHCGVGNPHAATAESGRAYFELVCERLAGFLVDIAKTPIDRQFPMQP